MKITRRKLALVLAAPAGLAQTPPAQAPADPLEAAKNRIKANGDALSKEAVPMATEPAFQFKA